MLTRTITLLMAAVFALALTGCTAQVSGPANVGDRQTAPEIVSDTAGDSSASESLIYRESSAESLGQDSQAPEFHSEHSNDFGEPDTPHIKMDDVEVASKIPSGSIALFYRTSFGSDTKSLKTVVTDARGEGNYGVAVPTWSTGSKGIVRYIPETGQTDVIKIIASPSYSQSSIYPVTIGDRLYAIRDWGSDWTVDNKRFTVEELDPQTGAALSSVDITAEWFTFLGNSVFFQDQVTENYWNGSRSGGELKVQPFGSSEVRDLSIEDVRLHSVADRLVSVEQQEIRWHDPVTANIQSTNFVEALSEDKRWPDARHIFYGDESVLWAWSESGSAQIHIIRVPFEGEPEVLVSFDLEGFETGLVIDEHEGMVLVGVAGSEPPRGIGITQMFLLNTDSGSLIELTSEQHIPSAQPDAGGGVQLLVMP